MISKDEKKARALTTKKEYTHYRKESGLEFKQRIIGRDEWIKFTNDFFKLVKDYAVNTNYGIYVPKLGYFFNWLCPKRMVGSIKRKREDGDKKLFNFHTQNRMYFPTFMPVITISYYSMDKTFSESYKKGLREGIMSGKRYKTYFYTLKRMKKIF